MPTTVFDPAGSPVITYNRDGVTVQNMVGGTADTFAAAVAIVRYSQVTIVVVSSPNSTEDPSVLLPSNAEIGDVVEVYGDYTTPLGRVQPTTWAQTGDTIMRRSGAGISAAGARFTRVSSTDWALMTSASTF